MLEFGGSESCGSSSDSDPAVQEKYIPALVGWTAKTPIEKKLVLGIMHRSGHKNFEEASEQQIESYKAGNIVQRKNSHISVSKRKLSISSRLSTQSPLMKPK